MITKNSNVKIAKFLFPGTGHYSSASLESKPQIDWYIISRIIGDELAATEDSKILWCYWVLDYSYVNFVTGSGLERQRRTILR